jgi:hypothetical protein
MKPRSRKVWLIIEIVILVAALVSLYVVYSRQAGEQEDLNARLAAAQALSSVLTANTQDLENQLVSATSSLYASQAQFPESVESIEYDDDLFKIADDYNVGITSLSASPPAGTTVGAIAYSVSSYALSVSGAVNDILDFIQALTTGEDFRLPWSAAVTSVNMDVGGSATINLIIYGYKG